ncbi:MAG: hypothetical protein A3J37_07635 [Alphaproteobacteria bacterium RIFCSPHIGHO2_12_FULL_45_9]|nr:MAG: hypothetical protein A3B66_02275 [Alphaproteobacteria bacterium RIFCSPHIGHO2_02_FULL_46_13]OFW97819.1 MAG: hypothetical protein A3J37_07635 [Alphaproteobacteria bacterium RIFCSPHIGHO2_12_FULL_45_9]
MFACNCRRIKDQDVEEFLNRNPQMLGKTWAIVSTAISGKPPVCNDGQGICTESANRLMELCQKGTPCPQ